MVPIFNKFVTLILVTVLFNQQLLAQVSTHSQNNEVANSATQVTSNASSDDQAPKLDARSEKIITKLQNFSATYINLKKKSEDKSQEKSNVFKHIKALAEKDQEEKNEDFKLTIDDKLIQAALKDAKQLKSEVQDFLFEESIPISDRFYVLIAYIQSVIHSVQQVLSLVWDKKKVNTMVHLTKDFILEFPAELLEDESLQSGLLRQFGCRLENGSSDDTKTFILEQSPMLVLGASAALKVSSKYNYMRALKGVTMSMMLDQIKTFQQIEGVATPFATPKACQTQKGTKLPEFVTFGPLLDIETRTTMIDNMLIEEGWIAGSYEYMQLYLESNYKPDFKNGGFNVSLPHQIRKNAVAALRAQSSGLEAGIDDFLFYDKVIAIKMQSEMPRYSNKSLQEKSNKSIKGFKPIITIDKESGLSEYLKLKMEQQNSYDWEKLVPEKVKKDLQHSNIFLKLPPLYGSYMWLKWGLMTLSEGLDKALKGNHRSFLSSLTSFCSVNMYRAHPDIVALCMDSKRSRRRVSIQETIRKLQALIGDFFDATEAMHMFNLNVKEDKLKIIYPKLIKIWKKLSKRNYLSDAKVSEWDYIKGQMNDQNPWAQARLGFLIYEYEKKKRSRSRYARRNSTRIGYKIGLDKKLGPMFANKILSKKEREIFWSMIKNENDENNQKLFKSRHELTQENEFDKMLKINNEVVLTQDSLDQTIDILDLDGNTDLMFQDLNQVFDTLEVKKGDKLYQIYKARNDVDRQVELAQEYMQAFNPDMDEDARIVFAAMDSRLKLPVFHQVVKQSARNRRNETAVAMEKLCNTTTDDVESFKEQYYMTSVAQEKVNKIGGLQAVPEEVTEQIDKWSQADWDSMKYSMYAAGLFMGGILLTGFTGGASLSLVAAAMTMSAGVVIYQERAVRILYKQYSEGKLKTANVELMYALGYTERDSISKMRRSFLEVGAEILFSLAMVGQVARSLRIGTRVLTSTMKGEFSNLSRSSKKLLIKKLIREVDVRTYKYLIGISNYEGAKKGIMTSIKERLVNEIVVKETPQQIDQLFAKKMVEILNDDPQKLIAMLKRYSADKLDRRRLIMKATKKSAHENKKFMDNLIASLEKTQGSAQLEKLILDNIEDVSKVFKNSPFSFREAPYFMLAEGMPRLSANKIKRMPKIARRVIIKRLVLARENLLVESYRRIAHETLGFGSKVKYHGSYDLYLNFQKTVQKAASKMTKAKAKRGLLGRIDVMEKEVANAMYEFATKRGALKDISKSELVAMLKNPKTLKDKVLLETLFNKIPAEKMYRIGKLREVAYEALKELSTSSRYGMAEFQDAYNALKILTVNKNPGAISQFM